MSETINQTLNGVAETLLLPLYIRAIESQRPDALIKDDQAVALIKQMNYDSSWITKMRVDEEDKVGLVLRNRELDRFARDFLARNPEAIAVHIGCGFDSRFERVDNSRVEWYTLIYQKSLLCAGSSSAMKGGVIISSLVQPSTMRG